MTSKTNQALASNRRSRAVSIGLSPQLSIIGYDFAEVCESCITGLKQTNEVTFYSIPAHVLTFSSIFTGYKNDHVVGVDYISLITIKLGCNRRTFIPFTCWHFGCFFASLSLIMMYKALSLWTGSRMGFW